MNYDALFVNPNGRTSQAQFIPALVTLLATIAFFGYMVAGRTAQFCMLVLLYPLFVLLARRLQDMRYPAWLLLVPLVLLLMDFAIRLGYLSLSESIDGALTSIALVIAAVFVLWACVGRERG